MTYKLILVDPDDLEKPLPLEDALRGFRSAYSNIRVDEAVEDLTRILIPEENNLSLFANHDQVWTSFHSQSHVEAVARAAHKLGRVVLGQSGACWTFEPATGRVEEGSLLSSTEAGRRYREEVFPILKPIFYINMAFMVIAIVIANVFGSEIRQVIDSIVSAFGSLFA